MSWVGFGWRRRMRDRSNLFNLTTALVDQDRFTPALMAIASVTHDMIGKLILRLSHGSEGLLWRMPMAYRGLVEKCFCKALQLLHVIELHAFFKMLEFAMTTTV